MGPPTPAYSMAPVTRQATSSTAFIASTGRDCAVRVAVASAAVCCGVPSGLTACPTGSAGALVVTAAAGTTTDAGWRPTSLRAAASMVQASAEGNGVPDPTASASATPRATGITAAARRGGSGTATEAAITTFGTTARVVVGSDITGDTTSGAGTLGPTTACATTGTSGTRSTTTGTTTGGAGTRTAAAGATEFRSRTVGTPESAARPRTPRDAGAAGE